MNKVSRQSGSVVSFVAIGLLLVGLLGGGIYLAKWRADAAKSASPTVAQDDSPKPPATPALPVKPATPAPIVTPAPKPATQTQPTTPAPTTPAPSEVAGTGPQAIPSTGLASTLSQLLAVGVLAVAITVYISSEKYRSAQQSSRL